MTNDGGYLSSYSNVARGRVFSIFQSIKGSIPSLVPLWAKRRVYLSTYLLFSWLCVWVSSFAELWKTNFRNHTRDSKAKQLEVEILGY